MWANAPLPSRKLSHSTNDRQSSQPSAPSFLGRLFHKPKMISNRPSRPHRERKRATSFQESMDMPHVNEINLANYFHISPALEDPLPSTLLAGATLRSRKLQQLDERSRMYMATLYKLKSLQLEDLRRCLVVYQILGGLQRANNTVLMKEITRLYQSQMYEREFLAQLGTAQTMGKSRRTRYIFMLLEDPNPVRHPIRDAMQRRRKSYTETTIVTTLRQVENEEEEVAAEVEEGEPGGDMEGDPSLSGETLPGKSKKAKWEYVSATLLEYDKEDGRSMTSLEKHRLKGASASQLTLSCPMPPAVSIRPLTTIELPRRYSDDEFYLSQLKIPVEIRQLGDKHHGNYATTKSGHAWLKLKSPSKSITQWLRRKRFGQQLHPSALVEPQAL
ncbi:uncharacterized protein BYT42DRAFT_618519 [Radiomyces spectabilis]|uniref:uncharacterized protein n=1 Tax=Radiomyces spectabilis TaxID=64574 RepID=UPI00221E5AAF|nr:uncharacterized protein BYT42DRAFT_618519 [Radiomyces spectabilis]KAI8366086.1 hypothetical protein BYT42DRAFT_618519 [Radiomyces spectabilis]